MGNPNSTNPHVFQSGYSGIQTGVNLNSICTQMQQAFVPLTNEQLNNLHTHPVTLIPSYGSNKAIVVVSSVYQLAYGGGNAFVSDDAGPGLFYGSFVANADGAQGSSFFANYTEDQIALAPTLNTTLSVSDIPTIVTSEIAGLPVVLGNPSSDMSDGGGSTGSVSALYYVVEII